MTDTDTDISYRPVHRLTPLLKLWTLIVALIAAVLLNLNAGALASIGAFMRGDNALMPILIAVGGLVGLSVLVWLVSYIWWRAMGYRLDEEKVAYRQGVISKRERTARYDRIEAVDVVEPFIARLFRVAAVRVETAGGKGSVIEIAYLNRAEASQLRSEILAHRRGTPAGTPGETQDEQPERTEAVVDEIPIGRSLAASALSSATPAAVIVLGIVALTPIPFATIIPILIGVVPAIWKIIDRSWRFRAHLVDDGETLDLNYGLASRRRQTVPLQRIHAVSIHQPVLWRLTGWWQVQVSVAGYGASPESSNSGSTTILPVGTREQAVHLAAIVGPLSRQEIETAARPEGHTQPTFTSPKRAFWVSPIDRDQQGVTLLDDTAITHRGRLARTVNFIAMSHIQELTFRRGLLNHLCNLADVRFDLVAGPVRMAGRDLSVDDGYELLGRLRQRSLPKMQPVEAEL